MPELWEHGRRPGGGLRRVRRRHAERQPRAHLHEPARLRRRDPVVRLRELRRPDGLQRGADDHGVPVLRLPEGRPAPARQAGLDDPAGVRDPLQGRAREVGRAVPELGRGALVRPRRPEAAGPGRLDPRRLPALLGLRREHPDLLPRRGRAPLPRDRVLPRPAGQHADPAGPEDALAARLGLAQRRVPRRPRVRVQGRRAGPGPGHRALAHVGPAALRPRVPRRLGGRALRVRQRGRLARARPGARPHPGADRLREQAPRRLPRRHHPRRLDRRALRGRGTCCCRPTSRPTGIRTGPTGS